MPKKYEKSWRALKKVKGEIEAKCLEAMIPGRSEGEMDSILISQPW